MKNKISTSRICKYCHQRIYPIANHRNDKDWWDYNFRWTTSEQVMPPDMTDNICEKNNNTPVNGSFYYYQDWHEPMNELVQLVKDLQDE